MLIEWMDYLCKGEMNRMNVNNILGYVEDITTGAVAMAGINTRRFQWKVKNLLEWLALLKLKWKRKSAEKTSEGAWKTLDGKEGRE